VTRASLLVLLLAATPVAAHDYWLVPDTFTPKVGKPLAARLHVGEAFKPEQEIGFQSKKTTILQLTAKDQVFRGVGAAKEGAKPAVAFDFPEVGSCVLEMQRDWSTITMKGDKFTAYLKEEGLDHVVKARAAAGESDADGKERYRRHLKVILHGVGKPDDFPTQAAIGGFDIVPGKNPYTLKAGDELPVTVNLDAKPVVGQKVTAFHRDGDTLTTVTATTDKDGKAKLKLTKSGPWLVRSVHMRRATPDKLAPDADWESFWCAVTFAVP
jgi:uncharacterized GH25 family protein